MKNGRSESSSTRTRRRKTSADPLSRVRQICLSLPGAFEKEAWGGPTFRAAHGMFAMWVDNHHGDGITGVWVKAAPGLQELLISENPEVFFRPPYMGHKGWVGIRLDGAVDWNEAAWLLTQAHELASTTLKRPKPARSPVAAFDAYEWPRPSMPIPPRWR